MLQSASTNNQRFVLALLAMDTKYYAPWFSALLKAEMEETLLEDDTDFIYLSTLFF